MIQLVVHCLQVCCIAVQHNIIQDGLAEVDVDKSVTSFGAGGNPRRIEEKLKVNVSMHSLAKLGGCGGGLAILVQLLGA